MPKLPYTPISQFYRELFGEKVYKISVAVAETCPNREGLRGMQTCNFCDQWGSAAYHKNLNQPLREQISSVRDVLRKKRGAQKFLVYYQAYTTTFSKVAKLREQFAVAEEFSDVVGLVVGTRPDCLSDSLFELWNETAEKKFVAVEMGVQTFDNEQLKWLRRGHTGEQSLKAIERVAKNCPKINLGMHLMFGLPGESDEQIIATAKHINSLPIHNVKLHNLHVLKETELQKQYERGEFEPIDRDVYFHRCNLFLQYLNPSIAVHRLAAFSPRADELIAPIWTGEKMKTYQEMLDFMNARGSYQGQLFHGN
jgi:radical SAM protein (TIGR01212 family)